MKNRPGFTLIEVLIVMAVMGILLSITSLDFNNWMKRYQTEGQAREIHSDVANFRLGAMQNKQRRAVMLGSNMLEFRTYSSPATQAGTVVSTKSLKYEIRKLVSGSYNVFDINADRIEFDERGFTNNLMTIVMLPMRINAGDNCLIVHTARTNLGRMTDASTCTER